LGFATGCIIKGRYPPEVEMGYFNEGDAVERTDKLWRNAEVVEVKLDSWTGGSEYPNKPDLKVAVHHERTYLVTNLETGETEWCVASQLKRIA
jgi:hypothetical protein